MGSQNKLQYYKLSELSDSMIVLYSNEDGRLCLFTNLVYMLGEKAYLKKFIFLDDEKILELRLA